MQVFNGHDIQLRNTLGSNKNKLKTKNLFCKFVYSSFLLTVHKFFQIALMYTVKILAIGNSRKVQFQKY
jgi:hypothetical protein